MQGSRRKHVCSALEELQALALDLVVMTRGGGECRCDLRCFDSYKIGKAIASFPVPVIAAIGTMTIAAWLKMFATLGRRPQQLLRIFILSLQQKVMGNSRLFFQINAAWGTILQYRRRELENVSLSFSLQPRGVFTKWLIN